MRRTWRAAAWPVVAKVRMALVLLARRGVEPRLGHHEGQHHADNRDHDTTDEHRQAQRDEAQGNAARDRNERHEAADLCRAEVHRLHVFDADFVGKPGVLGTTREGVAETPDGPGHDYGPRLRDEGREGDRGPHDEVADDDREAAAHHVGDDPGRDLADEDRDLHERPNEDELQRTHADGLHEVDRGQGPHEGVAESRPGGPEIPDTDCAVHSWPRAIERERWLGQRSDGDPHQQQRVVIAGCPVAVERSTSAATVDQHPLAVAANGDGDGFHGREAGRRAVTRLDVDVAAPQAIRAVVTVGSPRCDDWDIDAAMTASERSGLRQLIQTPKASHAVDGVAPRDSNQFSTGQTKAVPSGRPSGTAEGAGPD